MGRAKAYGNREEYLTLCIKNFVKVVFHIENFSNFVHSNHENLVMSRMLISKDSMKKLLLTVMSLMVVFGMQAQQIFVGSYNIRYNNPDDVAEANGWKQRCPNICDQINFEQPLIFGAQEVLHDQLVDLLAGIPQYRYLGVGREDGKEKGEYAAIFYRSDRLEVLKNGCFWLSQTPRVPSKGWDAACERICTWGLFKDKETKLKFFFFNCHMDHIGVVARRESARMIIDSIKAIGKDMPVILTGDFNVDQHDEIYKIFSESGILKDTYANAQQRMAPCGTFNGFMQDRRDNDRIDHVFVSPHFTVEHYGILTNSYWLGNTRRNLSDHYPVFVKLNWKK